MARSIVIIFYGENDLDCFLRQYWPSDSDYLQIESNNNFDLKDINIILLPNGIMVSREELYWVQDGRNYEEVDILFERIITKELTKYPNGYALLAYHN